MHSAKNDLYEVGGKILDVVADAVDKNDYKNLNQELKSVVSDGLKDSARNIRVHGNQPTYMRGSGVLQNQITPFLQRTTSTIMDYVKILSGLIGVIFFGIFTLAMLSGVLGFYQGVNLVIGIVVTFLFGGLTTACALVMKSGFDSKGLKDRYRLYGRFIGSNEYYSLQQLAQQTGRKLQDVQKDVLRLIHTGVLPQGRLDKQQTTLMLTDRAYAQYQQAEAAREMREREQVETQASMDEETYQKVSTLLQEGDSYLKTIRTCNQQIPDVEVSNKLVKLEQIMHRIFDQVKKNPSSADKLHRFMNYYLPTTTKLLYAYIDLEKGQGTNIDETKREIEEALDTINVAFEKLLDDLFQEVAWDISSDINVMKTMMEQDGLTESEFK